MRKLLLFFLVSMQCFSVVYAQGKSSYSYEISPVVGLNLPHDIDGANRSFYTLGVRTDIPVAPDFSIIGGALFHRRGQDKAFSFDGGGRLNFDSPFGSLFFDGGLHFSYFATKRDNGEARSITGTYYGAFAGGGFSFMFGALPIRILMRAHVAPSYWLLLEAGLALRF